MKAKLLAFNTDLMAYTAHKINVAGCRAQSGRATPSQTPAGPTQSSEGITGASGTADVPVFGPKAGHPVIGRTENPKTPPGGPPAHKAEDTSFDEAHARPSEYSSFAGGAAAWSNHLHTSHYDKFDRTDPSRTYRIKPEVFGLIRSRRNNRDASPRMAQTPYDQPDPTRAYLTPDGQAYFSA